MKKLRQIARTRLFEVFVVVLGVVCLAVLGPLRDIFEEILMVRFLAAFLLFLAPGAMVWRRFLQDRLPDVTVIPTAFVISSGTFALMAVPILINHLSLNLYIWITGVVVIASLVWAVIRILLGGPLESSSDDEVESVPESGSPLARGLLWGCFLGLGGLLASVSRFRGQGLYGDIWVYLAYIRDYLSTSRLALREPYVGGELGVSRSSINGWLLEQAALSRVSGIDPIEMIFEYLNPILICVALMSVYALARVLFQNRTAALVTGCVFALFYLIYLFPSVLTPGGEFVARQVEDKFSTKYVFLPMALTAAAAFLQSRKLSYGALFALICWSVMAIHPVGLALIGLSMTGFALVYLAVNWKSLGEWTRVFGLGAAGASVLALPALYVFTTGEALADVLKEADINSNDPDVLANMVFARPNRQRIFELGEDLYIMHPALLMNIVLIIALVLGIPFLIWKLKKGVAAPLLFGTLLISLTVCYVPPVATFVGNNVVVPGQLWRLAWPIPLAALATLGWVIWEATRITGNFLRKHGVPLMIVGLTPAVAVIALILATGPFTVSGVQGMYDAAELAEDNNPRRAPIFPWMRDNITEESVVLAPEGVNVTIASWSASANVVNYRGNLILDVLPALEKYSNDQIDVPQSARDVRAFYSTSTLEEGMEILRRYNVDYVMAYKDSGLAQHIESLPGTTVVEAPGEVFNLYAIDRQLLPTF
ncbi:hypothetical protein BH24ACT22_BH24ACT22_12020 [soil metagenome]